jgi:hypothetical protein
VDPGDDPVTGAARVPIPAPALALPAALALLAGLYAGLVRIGWAIPAVPAGLPADHGPLMIGGFLGTLITLERAVALGRRSGFVYPALAALGALAVLAAGGVSGPVLIAAASGGLVGMSAAITRRQPALHHIALTLGAASWLGGNALWAAGWPVYRVVPWWVAFLVLTIAGERLELSRVLRPARASQITFGALTAGLLAGVALTAAAPAAGDRLTGAALVAMAAWLVRYDVTRRTVRQSGLTRFIAAAMLGGYVWLAVGGALFALEAGRLVGGPLYDAALHAVFVGFVFSMIFGHAPIILPAVTGATVTYRPAFYAHLALLHLSLALRVAGDLAGWWAVRRWGGLLNAAAILLFLAATLFSVRRRAGRLSGRRPGPAAPALAASGADGPR